MFLYETIVGKYQTQDMNRESSKREKSGRIRQRKGYNILPQVFALLCKAGLTSVETNALGTELCKLFTAQWVFSPMVFSKFNSFFSIDLWDKSYLKILSYSTGINAGTICELWSFEIQSEMPSIRCYRPKRQHGSIWKSVFDETGCTEQHT